MKLERVFHQHHMDFTETFFFNRKNAEDFGNQRVRVLAQVVNVVRQDFEQHIDLGLAHCLDNIFSVMTEEKEATAFSRAFTRVENLLAVQLWCKGLLNQCHTQPVHAEQLGKLVQPVVGDVHECVINCARTAVIHGLALAYIRSKISSRCLTPFVRVLDFNLSKDYCDVTIFLDNILHSLEPLELVLCQTILNEIKQRKLTDTLKNHVDHFNVQG
jgi:hypothetical protein